MKRATQMMGRALLGALVLAWMATAGWSQSITWLGTLGGSESEAWDVSANGVVVGWAGSAAGRRAFRWTASGGMQDLGTLPGGSYSEANGVSANGAVVVGRSYNNSNQPRAFRWESGVMQDLGVLPGRNYSEAYGVSANGAVVVGTSDGRAFRWENGVMQDLGHLGGGGSGAYAVSADGSVVVGWSSNAAGQPRVFRWTASVGEMENLYATYGSLLTPDSTLEVVRAISPNGRYIVGWGINAATARREAFLLDTRPRCTAPDGDVNGDGVVDDADLLIVLFNFGNRYR
jgi:probable HAF family extracellular repeat protein